jgi:hypothetical protein
MLFLVDVGARLYSILDPVGCENLSVGYFTQISKFVINFRFTFECIGAFSSETLCLTFSQFGAT